MNLLTRLRLWLYERAEDRVSDEYLKALLIAEAQDHGQVVVVKKQPPPGPASIYTREAS